MRFFGCNVALARKGKKERHYCININLKNSSFIHLFHGINCVRIYFLSYVRERKGEHLFPVHMNSSLLRGSSLRHRSFVYRERAITQPDSNIQKAFIPSLPFSSRFKSSDVHHQLSCADAVDCLFSVHLLCRCYCCSI